MTSATLIIVGTPLDETARLPPDAVAALSAAQLCIGESRKIAMRYLVQIEGGREKRLFTLDHQSDDERREMLGALDEIARAAGTVALFSDCGMPILFDPGGDVLECCRQRGFRIRSCGAQTSWGTACALSGFGTPFLVLGFPARDNEERHCQLAELSRETSSLVLMDTPYRFTPLLSQCREAFGPDREAFVAWELGKPEERLLWGSLGELVREAAERGLRKGEFVLVIRGRKPRATPGRGTTDTKRDKKRSYRAHPKR